MPDAILHDTNDPNIKWAVIGGQIVWYGGRPEHHIAPVVDTTADDLDACLASLARIVTLLSGDDDDNTAALGR